MFDDFPSHRRLEVHRDDETNGPITLMDSSSRLISTNFDTSVHIEANSSNTINVVSSSNSTSSSSIGDQQSEQVHSGNSNLRPDQYFDHHQRGHQQYYFNVDQPASYNAGDHRNNFNPIASSPNKAPISTALDVKPVIPSSSVVRTMNVDSTQHSTVVPTAHCSDHQMHYSLPSTKHPPDTGSSGVLNFSHDLLQQNNNHHHNSMHQHTNNSDIKPNMSNTFDLDSGSLMQSAAVGMNMWKNTMSLNHFKHPVISDHNFLPNSDINSFQNWTHGNNHLSHQPSSMTHHILEGQHLIGYSQHQRSLPLPNQDLVGAAVKNQSPVDQASFMLNSINHQASTSQNSSSSHQASQPLDNLNLRSHPLDHSASYNLSMNDNQFYNSSRSDNRSHQNTIKPSLFAGDRSVHVSLGNHSSQASYLQGTEHANSHATTSHHHVAGIPASSSGISPKNVGNFRCPTCSEVFTLRTVYQSHLKTHSQDKSKAKFSCELCGHSFSQKTSLNRHMKSHTGERPFPCEICAKAFSEKERLKIHMRTHTGEKPFSCGICGKSFSQKSTVKRHQTVHTGEKKFRCDCGKGFANRGNLIAHIKTRGTNHFE